MNTPSIKTPNAPEVVLPAANTDRSYQKLAAQVLELIGQGEFASGARLPSERALAERFDVSRTSVREAIIALEL
ncbi:MAG: GntR family transcriptional regulator, partial [Polaromonas sp.]